MCWADLPAWKWRDKPVTVSEHPFDRLTFDVLWETSAHFTIFGREARLSVRAEADGPEQWQRDAFDSFMANQELLRPVVLEALFRYYLSVAPEYRDMFSPESQHLVPVLTGVQDLDRVLTAEAVYIDDLDADEPEIGLLYDCTWDDSHGVGVRLRGQAVLEVGPQDICL
jgi:hypothetical protein